MKNEVPSNLSWLTAFQKAYKKYKKQYSEQGLPEYSDLIGEYFFKLSTDISNIPIAPDAPGTLWERTAKDHYKIRKFLSENKIDEITFYSSGPKLRIKSLPIIDAIIHNLVHDITSYPLEEPKSGDSLKPLARLLSTSKELIVELKEEGITDDLLAEFIPKAVTYAPPSALSINPAFNVDSNSVVPIASVEAFQKALKRA